MHVWVCVVVVCEYTCLRVSCGHMHFACISTSAFRMVDTNLQVYVHVSVINTIECFHTVLAIAHYLSMHVHN